MQNGLFITLYDEKALALYLKHGIYSFLMPPVFESKPSNRSMHYHALADYACAREGTQVFFFLKRMVIYGGTVIGNKDIASFYLNGTTSPLCLKAKASLFWDESARYESTELPGVFKVNEKERAQPYVLRFCKNTLTGKKISSDELYFKLGQYPYPLSSNTIQGMSFCTITPGETSIALKLLEKSAYAFDNECMELLTEDSAQVLFDESFLDSFVFQSVSQKIFMHQPVRNAKKNLPN